MQLQAHQQAHQQTQRAVDVAAQAQAEDSDMATTRKESRWASLALSAKGLVGTSFLSVADTVARPAAQAQSKDSKTGSAVTRAGGRRCSACGAPAICLGLALAARIANEVVAQVPINKGSMAHSHLHPSRRLRILSGQPFYPGNALFH